MWTVNNQKAQSKTFLKNDVQNMLTQLNNEERKINEIIATANRAIGGLPSGDEKRLTDKCHEARNSLNTVRRLLATCNECISQLDVREWISDD